MKEFKSVQDLIVKAALYDGVSTTISAEKWFGDEDMIKITFSKDNRHSAHVIYTQCKYDNHEELALNGCKRALRNLLFAPYEEIEVNKENNYEFNQNKQTN